MKLAKIRQLYTRRRCARENERQWVDNSRRYFQMGLRIVSHVTWAYRCVGAHYNEPDFRCVRVFVLASMRLTVKMAYADKIWPATIHHTVTFYCCICTRYTVQRTSTCEHLLVARATFSFLFCLFRFVFLKSMTECTAITRAHQIDFQTWVNQTADVMCGLLLLNKCIWNRFFVWLAVRWCCFNRHSLMRFCWNNIHMSTKNRLYLIPSEMIFKFSFTSCVCLLWV